MSDRVAVVTGGAGFIGRHLVSALLAEGTQVRVVDPAHRPTGLPPAVDYRCASILDREALRAAFSGAEEVYHVAAVAHLWIEDPRRYETVNVDGTRMVLDAAREAGAGRIVVTSTETMLRAWRDRSSRPLSESDPVPPLKSLAGIYTRSKARAHDVTLAATRAGQPIRIVYPTIPIGPGDDALTPPTVMVRDFLLGHTPAYLDRLMNYIPVEDAAQGHLLAARRGVPGGRYILAGEDLWVRQFLSVIERVSGRSMPRLRIPYWLAYCTGAVSTALCDGLTRRPPKAPLEGVRLVYASRPVDGSHARDALGFSAGPVEEAVRRLVAWLKAEKLVS